MAGKAATKSTKSKGKSKTEAAAPEAIEEVDGEDVEATETKGGAQQEVTFGASDLAKLLSDKSGKKVTPRELRTLIRKMARDGSKRVNREIVAGNRSRYDWSGPEDPEVKAIIAAFEGGELEADKKEKLDALKANKAAKKAAKDKDGEKAGKGGKKGKKDKAATEPVESSDDDDDLDLDED